MKGTIRLIRGTAKVLLVVVPVVLVTGFLTAKPFLGDPSSFEAYRLFHTIIAPLLFLPIFYLHTLAGIRYLVGRSKRLDRPWIRWVAVCCWTLVVGVVAAMYLGEVPPPPPDRSPAPVGGADGGGGDGSLDAVGGETDGAPGRAGSGVDSPGWDAAEVGDGGIGEPTLADRPTPSSRPPRPRQRRGGGQGSAPSARAAGDLPADGGAISPAPPTRDAAPGRRGDGGGASSASSPPAASTPTPDPPPAEAPSMSGSALVRSRCVGCHALETVYGGESRSAAEWQQVVSRMVAMGARLSDDERRAVIRHLSSR